MPGSPAEEIVVDFLEAEEWSELVTGSEAEPDLDLPPLPPPRPLTDSNPASAPRKP